MQAAELGHAFSNSKQFAEAAATFTRATALEQKKADVRNDLEAMQLELGDLPVAQHSFETGCPLEAR